MITYLYYCDFCEVTYEIKHGATDEELNQRRECHQCGCELKRIITGGAGFILKGDGWAS